MKRRWEQSGSWCIQAPCTHWSFCGPLFTLLYFDIYYGHCICLRQTPFAIWRMFYSCPRKALVRLIAFSRQSLHVLLMRLCLNMSDPPQGLQTLLWRMCSQMLNPLHYLHGLLVRLCSQMLGQAAALLALASFAVVLADGRPTAFLAPASTTLLVWLCSQMLDPPLNLQRLLQGLDLSLRTNHGQPSVAAKFSLCQHCTSIST
jgi:hypothetical protein